MEWKKWRYSDDSLVISDQDEAGLIVCKMDKFDLMPTTLEPAIIGDEVGIIKLPVLVAGDGKSKKIVDLMNDVLTSKCGRDCKIWTEISGECHIDECHQIMNAWKSDDKNGKMQKQHHEVIRSTNNILTNPKGADLKKELKKRSLSRYKSPKQ